MSSCLVFSVGNSCPVPTKDISMEAIVLDTGSRVRAVADFQDGPRGGLGSQRLQLCDNDILTINGLDATETEKSDRIEYSVTWDLDQAPDQFEFALDRENQSNVRATVTLPPRFSIVVPIAGDTLPRSVDTTLEWDPPRDGGQILVTIDDEIGEPCKISANAPPLRVGVELPDTGIFTVLADTLELEPNPTMQTECDAFVRLSRINPGDYPAELEDSGRVEARVERRIDFLSVP